MRTASWIAALTLALPFSAGAATALPPIEDNPRIMGELVAGEVGYQIHKHCPSISMRKLRAYGRLNKLADHARSLGYSDDDFKALSKDKAARAKRDAQVDAYLAKNGVTEGDAESYCTLGRKEIAEQSLTGWLLRE